MGFYGSNDPTNSVKALKEDRSKGLRFNLTRSTPPCSQYYDNYVVWNIKTQIHTDTNKSMHSEMGPVRQNPIGMRMGLYVLRSHVFVDNNLIQWKLSTQVHSKSRVISLSINQ